MCESRCGETLRGLAQALVHLTDFIFVIIMMLLLLLACYVHAFQGGLKPSDVQRILQLRQEEPTHTPQAAEPAPEPVPEHTFQIDDAHPPQAMLNIDFIFGGYNLFYANPLTYEETLDPGFTGRNIFDASYSQKRVSLDGRYKLPDGVTIMNKRGCKFSFDAKIVRVKEDFQKYMSTFVGLNLASNLYVTPWAFTASQEYNYMQEMIEQRGYQFPLAHTICTLYQVTMDTTQPPPFNPSFLKALDGLPHDYDAGSYIEFFSTYGTHYIKSMILGSRMGMIFAMAPEAMQQTKGERMMPKWRDEELELAAKITAQFVKGVINTQILPRNQSSKAFTDLTKVALNTFMIEIGPQPTEASQKGWAQDTEIDPMPVKYQIGGLVELIEEGKAADEKIVKNLRLGLVDYCGMLSAQNARYGPCVPTSEMIKDQLEKRTVCLNFFENCDYTGQSVSVCGNRNPVQNIGIQLPEVTAGSVKFYSETPVIVGTSMFTIDYDQSVVMQSFHNDFLFFEKSEQCFVNQELGTGTRVRIYITEPKRCMVVLLWNYCPGYAVRYFSSVLCNSFDVNDNFKAAINEVRTCEVAILDIRFPMAIPLRICLFKNSKLTGEKVCFGSETAEQFYGQSFRSLLIDESEVVVHKAMPASMTVHFDESEEEVVETEYEETEEEGESASAVESVK